MPYEIFLSYRRKDTGGYAGRLFDHLVEKFGRDGVLFDVEVAGTAEVLREWVSRVVPEAAVELVLFGEDWLIDRHGRRRLHEPDDIVRLEVELALAHKVPIIPVLVDGAPFPIYTGLPDSIKDLAQFKGYEVNNSHWEAKVGQLVEAISFVTNTHVPILRRGVEVWNAWREHNPGVVPNLAFGNFAGKNLETADLRDANLYSADLSDSTLRGANLKSANVSQAHLVGANLEAALLSDCNLTGANLTRAVLRSANLERADLSHANLNEADLAGANIAKCSVYGVSVWAAKLENATQSELLLTRGSNEKGANITVDSIQMAVVIHVLLTSGGVRELIDVLTSKVVLVLGRFTSERMRVLEALRDQLRARNYLAVMFDFERPQRLDLSETISLLAHMSRFIIADFTDARSIFQELQHIVPNRPSLPVQPLVLSSQYEYAMFEHFSNFHWVLSPYRYDNPEALLSSLEEKVIGPAEAKGKEMEEWREAFKEKLGG